MLVTLLASAALFTSAFAAPLFVPGATYPVDKSIKDPGVSYKGADSGWFDLKLEGKNPASGQLLHTNTMRAHFKRLPKKTGPVDRYELILAEMKTEGPQGTHDFTREITGKKLVAYDAGMGGEELSGMKKEDKAANSQELAGVKVDTQFRNTMYLQVGDLNLSGEVFYMSSRWTCLSGLGGKAVGAKWKKQIGPKSTEDCEFAGWTKVKGEKVAIVNFTSRGEVVMDAGTAGKMSTKFERKGAYVFNPATQELLREMTGTFSTKGFEGQTYTGMHVYPEMLSDTPIPAAPAPAAPAAAPAPAAPAPAAAPAAAK